MLSTPAPALTAIAAARKLLAKIDNMTTEEFERGGEREEREALRAALAVLDATNA